MKFDDFQKTSEDISAVMDYWRNLPVDPVHKMPLRKDFNPMHIARHLPAVFLSQWISDRDILIKLAGSKTVDWLDADLTGKLLFDVLPPAAVEVERQFYEEMRDTPCGGSIIRSASLNAQEKMRYQTVYLPMWHSGDNFVEFLGIAHGSERRLKPMSEEEKVQFEKTSSEERHYIDTGNGMPYARLI